MTVKVLLVSEGLDIMDEFSVVKSSKV